MGFILRLPNRRVFCDRVFDGCFENGDADEVVRHIIRLIDHDPALQKAIQHPYVKDYIALDKWREVVASPTFYAPTEEQYDLFAAPLPPTAPAPA